jgi:hypothetical protein
VDPKEKKQSMLDRMNANNAEIHRKMKEAAEKNGEMDSSLREAILKIGAKPSSEG